MITYQATIVGTTALLQHRFSESSEVQKPTRKMLFQAKSTREEAEKSCYRLPDGKLYFPGQAISRMIREAGSNHKLTGSRRSAKFAVGGSVVVSDEFILLLEADAKTPKTSFEVDSRPVVIPATKGRIMRHRPRHDSWSAKFSIRINDSILPQEFIHQLLQEGGQQIGIGDFRPEKGGPFGTFNVTEWKQVI